MEQEPQATKTGFHLIHIHGDPYLLMYHRRIRGHKEYAVIYPRVPDTFGTWEECVIECKAHWNKLNGKGKRRSKKG